MGNETIADLRTELFATLRGLNDKQNPMEIERARAVSEVAQTIINSAKVEVEHMKVAGGKGSGFLPQEEKTGSPSPQIGVSPTPTGVKQVSALPGGRTVTTHRLK